MKTKLAFIILLSVVVSSCKSETKEQNSTHDSEVKPISIVDTLSLKLIDNEKWIANSETHEGIMKMDSIISIFKRKKSSDYKVLGDQLAKQTGYIIKHCSMKGEPHDQLHVVLIPMLDEISVLREEDEINKTKPALVNLEQLISAYFKHFRV